MVFQPDGFYNLPAISSSIKLCRDLCIRVSVHMAVLLVTSNKLITLLEPCSHSLGSPGVALAGRGVAGGLFPACPCGFLLAARAQCVPAPVHGCAGGCSCRVCVTSAGSAYRHWCLYWEKRWWSTAESLWAAWGLTWFHAALSYMTFLPCCWKSHTGSVSWKLKF